MKKYLTILFTLLLSISFTSCEDEAIADTLQGTWEGNMYISHSWNGRVYESTYSEIEFLLDPFRYKRGSGYWVDHYSNAPWDYIANHIDWRVDDRVIKIYFREEDSYLEIANYRLNNNYFTGIIYDGDLDVEFKLRHTSSPNWNRYQWGTDYWYSDWYSRRSAFISDTDSVTVPLDTRSSSAEVVDHSLPSDSLSNIERPKRMLRIR